MRRYDHLERLGHDDTEGILHGRVHVFPKLDGTNGSVWSNGDGIVRAASRNRELCAEADNHRFYAWLHGEDAKAAALRAFAVANPGLVVYGEWMVPHTLKTYREEAWSRFWVFDVWSMATDRYLPHEVVASILPPGVDVIEPLCTITNPTMEQVQAQVETNTYLIADGAGLGEGVVAKNYLWTNKFGRQPWAKVVRNSFKEENRRAFGTTEKTGAFQVEVAIAEEFVTPHLVGKTRAKIVADIANEAGIDLTEPNAQKRVESGYRPKLIPQLLGRVYHDLIVEELWAALKKHKNCTVNFRELNGHCTRRVKELASDLF